MRNYFSGTWQVVWVTAWLAVAPAVVGAPEGEAPTSREAAESRLTTPAVILDPLQQAYLDARGSIRVCVDPDWLPMEEIDAQGRHVGLAADFLELIASRGNMDLELVATRDWSQSLEYARERECDILSMAMETPARSEFMDFTEPYLEVPYVIVTRMDVPYVDSLEYVLDQPVGIMRDFSFVELYRDQYPGIHLIEVDSYEEGMMKVQRGELFGFLGNMASVSHAMQSMGVSNLKIAGRVEGDSRLSVAVRNDEPILAGTFQALVSSIDQSDRQALFNRWVPIRMAPERDYRFLWTILLPILGVALIALLWSERIRRLNRKLNEANRRLQHLSRRDALTGLHNRLYLDEQLENLNAYCGRNHVRLSVAMIDLDFFKAINDQYGHPYGDQCLIRVAGVLGGVFQRETDTVVRYGGEEFVVMVVGGDPDSFRRRLETVRLEVATLEGIRHDCPLHVSIGAWSGVPSGQGGAARFLDWADQNLYRAKASGRDRIILASDVDVTGQPGHRSMNPHSNTT